MEKRKDRNDADVKLSKALSWLLRHGAEKEGVKVNADGYAKMEDVLNYMREQKGFNTLKEHHILHIVDTNDKKRFQVKQDIDPEKQQKVLWIRATQGHSMKVIKTEELLEPIQDPTKYPVVVHGTYRQYWPAIEKEGLRRMTRLHMHFAPGYPKEQGVISGMRGSCDFIIEIDMAAAIKDGIKFFISKAYVIKFGRPQQCFFEFFSSSFANIRRAFYLKIMIVTTKFRVRGRKDNHFSYTNNVILTEGIDGTLPPKYFKKVTERK